MILILEDDYEYKERILDALEVVNKDLVDDCLWYDRAEDAIRVIEEQGATIDLAILDIDLGARGREYDGIKVGQFIEEYMRQQPAIGIAVLYLTKLSEEYLFGDTSAKVPHRVFIEKDQIASHRHFVNAVDEAYNKLQLRIKDNKVLQPVRELQLVKTRIPYSSLLWMQFKDDPIQKLAVTQTWQTFRHEYPRKRLLEKGDLHIAGLLPASGDLLVYLPNVKAWQKEGRYLRLFFEEEHLKNWMRNKESLEGKTILCSKRRSRDIGNWLRGGR